MTRTTASSPLRPDLQIEPSQSSLLTGLLNPSPQGSPPGRSVFLTASDQSFDHISSLSQLLTKQAQDYTDQLALRYLQEDGSKVELTFGDLHERALAIGYALSTQLKPGDRALLVYPPGLEFLCAFFGCMYAGVIATPATYPKPRRPLPRMSRIAADSGAKVALTTAQTLETIDLEQQDDVARKMAWLATDEFSTVNSDWSPHDASGEDLAFLQYTSGSTSDPKGVMVSHANLLANLEAIRVAFGLGPSPAENGDNIGVFWLPAYHDMGLIGGVLTPLYVGGPTILMAPTTFLQKPIRWLEAIDEYRGTISGAPDFAYRLCMQKSTQEQRDKLDLSSWRLAFCGAEPVHASTLTSFAESFEQSGFRPSAFYPCYGLAEATLLAAGPDCQMPPTILTVDREALAEGHAKRAAGGEHTQQLVGCGTPPDEHQLLIVDPDAEPGVPLTVLPEGEVGEIIVAGPSVATGYWHREEATTAAFGWRAVGRPQTYLRTGDLGFLEEGELFVTGRLKDMIILRGRNYYPQDIEQIAEAAHADVLPGAAFTTDVEGEQRLVLVHQVDRSCRGEARQVVAEAIRKSVRGEFELDPHAVVLIRQTSLPVTSSGKVQRSRCREMYLSDELKTLFELKRTVTAKPLPLAGINTKSLKSESKPAPSLDGLSVDDAAETVEKWLGEWMVEQIEISPEEFDFNRPFAESGLDSITGVELSVELEETFGVPLPAVVAWNYPTPAALSRYIAEQTVARETPAASNPQDELEDMLADIENLSDEEAQRLLGEE